MGVGLLRVDADEREYRPEQVKPFGTLAYWWVLSAPHNEDGIPPRRAEQRTTSRGIPLSRSVALAASDRRAWFPRAARERCSLMTAFWARRNGAPPTPPPPPSPILLPYAVRACLVNSRQLIPVTARPDAGSMPDSSRPPAAAAQSRHAS